MLKARMPYLFLLSGLLWIGLSSYIIAPPIVKTHNVKKWKLSIYIISDFYERSNFDWQHSITANTQLTGFIYDTLSEAGKHHLWPNPTDTSSSLTEGNVKVNKILYEETMIDPPTPGVPEMKTVCKATGGQAFAGLETYPDSGTYRVWVLFRDIKFTCEPESSGGRNSKEVKLAVGGIKLPEKGYLWGSRVLKAENGFTYTLSWDFRPEERD
jgi:hypothetical protein